MSDPRQKLDARVLALIEKYAPVGSPGLLFRELCEQVGIAPHGEEGRSMDRALQRLRRAGKVRYGGNIAGWRIPSPDAT